MGVQKQLGGLTQFSGHTLPVPGLGFIALLVITSFVFNLNSYSSTLCSH